MKSKYDYLKQNIWRTLSHSCDRRYSLK